MLAPRRRTRTTQRVSIEQQRARLSSIMNGQTGRGVMRCWQLEMRKPVVPTVARRVARSSSQSGTQQEQQKKDMGMETLAAER